MLAWFTGLLLFSLALLSSSAIAADGNKEIFSPWTSAPSCPSGRACIYHLASGGQLYVVDGNGATQKIHAAKSFRTSANCAGLSSPANGDVCYDTTSGYFRVYSGGWKTAVLAATLPLSISGETMSLAYSSPLTVVGGSLALASGGLVYAHITGGGAGALGAATVYLRPPGVVATSTEYQLARATRGGAVRNLYCKLGTAPGGADTVIVTVRRDASDLAVTCTISGASTTCSDSATIVSVLAAENLSIKAVSSAGTAADLTCSVEVTN
jgi:hypothetical protein